MPNSNIDDFGYYLADWLDNDQLGQLMDDQIEDDALYLSLYEDYLEPTA